MNPHRENPKDGRQEEPIRQGTRRDDGGQAVLAGVILVALVLAIVAATLFQTSADNITNSTTRVSAVQALEAAQSGLSIAYHKLQTVTALDKAPCTAIKGTLGASSNAGTYRHTSKYTVTFTYYKTLNATPSKKITTCAKTEGKSTWDPQAVELTSVGTSTSKFGAKKASNFSRTMKSEAILATKPTSSGFALTDTLFINATFKITGDDSINGTAYVNGSLSCTAGGKFVGTFTVAGTADLTGGCTITGSLEATGRISQGKGSTHVSGTLTSTKTTKTTPTITLAGTITGMHTMYAKGKIHLPSSVTAAFRKAHKVATDTASLTTPPSQTMPAITWSASAWQAEGYTTVITNTCKGSSATGVYSKIKAMSTATKTLAVYTTCRISLGSKSTSKITTVTLNKNLALFAIGGFAMTANVNWVAAVTVKPDLYLIVPKNKSTGTAVTCPTPKAKKAPKTGDITMARTAKISTGVSALLYTPCTATMSGTTHVDEGQLYTGKFTGTAGMSFGSPPSPAGLKGTTEPNAQKAFSVGIIYERET